MEVPEARIQELVDDLLDALSQERAGEVRGCGTRLVQSWGSTVDGAVAEGVLVKPHEVDPATLRDRWFHKAELLEAVLAPGRYQQRVEGAELTNEEVRAWVLSVASMQLLEADGEHDAWQVVPITNSAKVAWFVAQVVSGSSWEGIESEFVGAFRSVVEARSALQARGYLDEDDLRERYLRPGASA